MQGRVQGMVSSVSPSSLHAGGIQFKNFERQLHGLRRGRARETIPVLEGVSVSAAKQLLQCEVIHEA